MKKFFALLLTLAMAICLLSGCGQTGSSASEPNVSATEDPGTVSQPPATDNVETGDAHTPQNPNVGELPLVDEPITLTVWDAFNPGVLPYLNGFNDNLILQRFAKDSNVTLEATCVNSQDAGELFPIMIASDEYCDYINKVSNFYSGGVNGAYDDGVVLCLDDYVEKYCPNFMSRLAENEHWQKDIITDEGHIFTITGLTYNKGVEHGLVIRTDWLDKIGMDAPKTYDQLHDVLTAFKTELNAQSALWVTCFGMGQMNTLASGYGIGPTYDAMASYNPFYAEDGKVHFSYVEDAFKDYLTMLNQWYGEGLIWKGFVSDHQCMSTSQSDGYSELLNGQMGVFYESPPVISQLPGMVEGMTLSALAEPTKTEGEMVHTMKPVDELTPGWCISTACEYPELACVYLDYFFTDEMSKLCSYGYEGEAYNMEGGKVVYTDLITSDAEFGNTEVNTYKYLLNDFPFYYDFARNNPFYDDSALKCFEVWSSNRDNTGWVPSNMTLTLEETESFNGVYMDLITYANENIPAFVTGERSLDSFGDFVAELERIGVRICVDAYQGAYDRYMSRCFN